MRPDDKPADQQQETQLTQPKKGEPVEIPVPKRKDVLGALEKAARPATTQEQ
jgi:hypothetical protein